jgi:AraC-like DNA-binding protein/ligand-binding sensor protein
MNMDGKDNRKLIEALIQSPVFRDFERSFSEATGLPIALVPLESWHLTFHGHRKENHFCALLSSCGRACATCLETQKKLTASATQAAKTLTCSAGLCETAVPVRVGDQLIGFLRTGQIFQTAPSPKQFHHLERLAKCWGLPLDENALRAAYLNTTVLERKQYSAMVHLLNLFAQHLGILSNQLLLRQANAKVESPIVARARAFIEEHFTERLTLLQVATASFMSQFHFCKVFKQATGLTFTAFVGRLRIEKAKNLLLNPNYRVSEIGYAVGFQSLSHFNRKFSQYVGESPTNYRLRIQPSLVAGRETGEARTGTSSASALKAARQPLVGRGVYSGKINGTVRSEFPTPIQPTRRTLRSGWFPPPHMALPGVDKRAV